MWYRYRCVLCWVVRPRKSNFLLLKHQHVHNKIEQTNEVENILSLNTHCIYHKYMSKTHIFIIWLLNKQLTISCLCCVRSHPWVFASQIQKDVQSSISSQNKLAPLPTESLTHKSLLFQLNYDSQPPKLSSCQNLLSAQSRSVSLWFPSQSDRITVPTLRGAKRNTVHLATRRQCGRLQTFTGTAPAKFS